jgi:uncharacterized protein
VSARTDPFVVHAARLLRDPGAHRHEVRVGEFDPTGSLRPLSSAISAVPVGAEAVCDIVLQHYEGGIMATGTVTSPWEGVCRRCALPVGGTLTAAVRERFVADPDDDDDAYPIAEGDLDLGPLVREAVVLELPLAPLCREDCRGLCPHCGADRNEGECGCVAPGDPRWANLDVLR